MNRKEAAELCNRSVRTISQWVSDGKLKAQRVQGPNGEELFITEDDLIASGLLKKRSSSATVFATVLPPEDDGRFSRVTDEDDSRVDDDYSLNRQLMTMTTQATVLQQTVADLQTSHMRTVEAKDKLIETLESQVERLQRERDAALQEAKEMQKDHITRSLEAAKLQAAVEVAQGAAEAATAKLETAQKEVEVTKTQLEMSEDKNKRIIESIEAPKPWWKIW